MKTPAAFFPVSTRTIPIAKYLDNYSEEYYITTLLTYPGSSLSGKDIGYADNQPCFGKNICVSLQETKQMWTTLLVADNMDIDSINDDMYNLTIDTINEALLLRKTVICAACLKPEDLKNLVYESLDKNSQFIYLPDREKLPLSKDKGRLYSPIAPVIFVGGLLDEANVLEIFLAISKKFKSYGFNAIPISINANCGLMGIATINKITYKINEVQKVYAFNNFIKIIEEDKHPDIFIVHLSEAIMEYNEIVPNGFGLLPYIISKALTPDFFICGIPCLHANSEFISAISEGVVTRFGYPIDYIHISNVIVDGAMISDKESLSFVYTTQEDVNDRVEQLQSNTEIPALNLLNERDLNLLCKDIGKRLKDNRRATIVL